MNRIRSQGLLSARLWRTPLAIWTRLYAKATEGQAGEEIANCKMQIAKLSVVAIRVAEHNEEVRHFFFILQFAICILHFAVFL
jgi:hypothetical protein